MQWVAQKAGSWKYCQTRAALPAAAGVAIEVPALPRNPHVGSVLPSERAFADIMYEPGVVMSGLKRPSKTGPEALKPARVFLGFWLEPATATTFFASAGDMTLAPNTAEIAS